MDTLLRMLQLGAMHFQLVSQHQQCCGDWYYNMMMILMLVINTSTASQVCPMLFAAARTMPLQFHVLLVQFCSFSHVLSTFQAPERRQMQ